MLPCKSQTPHFSGTHICTLTVKVNGICCIQNPLQGLNTKRRRRGKLQICWKILYLRRQEGCVWHLCLGIPKSQGCEEMTFQSKIGNVKLFYIEGLTIFKFRTSCTAFRQRSHSSRPELLPGCCTKLDPGCYLYRGYWFITNVSHIHYKHTFHLLKHTSMLW